MAQAKKPGPKPKGTLIIHFLSDLLRKKTLQKKFAQDPKAAMKSAGLTKSQIDAITNKKVNRVMAAAGNEIANMTLIEASPVPWPM